MRNTPSLLPWAFVAAIVCLAHALLGQDPPSQEIKCFNESEAPPPGTGLGCNDLAHYIPTAATPVKTVRIAFHIMQRADPNPEDPIEVPKENFDETDPDHVAYLDALFNRLNSLYSFCNVMWCGCQYQNQLNYNRDTRIRFELVGTFYHRDNAGNINGDGTYDNLYCYNNYAICKDEVLNVFFCQIPDVTSGYGPPSHVMLFNLFKEYQHNPTGWWGAGNVLGHEIGHVLSLAHPWEFKYTDQCQSESGPNFCDKPAENCACGNNMMSYARLADFVSPMQMGAMHRSLLSGSASKYLVTEYDPVQNIVITQPTAWDHSRIVRGDVIIQPGATLTITCKTIMARNTRIVVQRGAKLVVDGATITTKSPAQTTCNGAPSFYRWTGIEVWGNSADVPSAKISDKYILQPYDPGLVVLRNKAVIENAQVGVYAQRRDGAWNQQMQYFGGMLLADDAAFVNCRKAVEYISHYPLNVPSSFTDCTFEQNFQPVSPQNVADNATFEGVTSWQVSGLRFSGGCKFKNLERGIVFGNASGTVHGSKFTQLRFATEMAMTAPMADKQTSIGGPGAGGNEFLYCDYPVYATSYGYLQVYNNRMVDCRQGVHLQGSSIYRIEENQFIQSDRDLTKNLPVFIAGISLFQTGASSANDIRCNLYDVLGTDKFDDPYINNGIYVAGENGNAYWSGNRFECKWDVRLVNLSGPGFFAQGRLPDQGADGKPAFNEFSLYQGNPNDPGSKTDHLADIHTPPPGTANATAPFTYYPPTSNCLSRLLPRCPKAGTCANACQGDVYNFINDEFSSSDYLICSFGPVDGILSPEDCHTRACLDQYYQALAVLDAQIALSNDYRLQQERLNLNNRKMALLHYLTDELYRNGQIEQAAQLWAADPDRYSREALVGLRLQTGNYAAVAQLLNNYPTADPEDARFKFIQTVHVNRLVNAENFQLSDQDAAALYEMAENYSLQSGYAQSLLKWLDGAVFEPEYETAPAGAGRSPVADEMPAETPLRFALFPNPAGEQLTVEARGMPSVEYQFTLYDLYGQLLREQTVHHGTKVDISSLIPGMYWVTMKAPDGTAQTMRFVKTKH